MPSLHNGAPGVSVLYDTLTTTINLLTLNPLPYIEVDYMNATDKKLAHLYGPWFTAGVPDCNTIDERNYWIDYIANNDESYIDTVKCFMSIMRDIIATEDLHNLTY